MRIVLLLSLLTFFLAGPTVAFAAPTISSVTGTVKTGQVLTITGADLGVERSGTFGATAGSFEGASAAADGWVGDAGYSTEESLFGSQSYQSDITATHVVCSDEKGNDFGNTAVWNNIPGAYSRIYVRFKSGFESLWNDANYTKMIIYTGSNAYIQPRTGSTSPTQLYTHSGSSGATYYNIPNALETDRWYCIEYRLETTGMFVWLDGEYLGKTSSTTSLSPLIAEFGISNACVSGLGSYSMYFDALMTDTSRLYPLASVEISGDNGSTWKYQPPESLSASSITITADLPTLTTSGYLLRVTDSSQVTSSTYDLGGAQAPTCSDGIQNGDETGVDCGGSCSACPVSSMPTKETNLFTESFENDSWTSRGWIDGTNSIGTTAGGYSGNALKWTWASSATKPTGFSTIRNVLSQDVDEFLVEYYVKFDTGWQGSGRTYHPHYLHLMSNADYLEGEYNGISIAKGGFSFEALADTSSPYTIYPSVAYQDSELVNTEYGTPPQDLTSTTEDRSATQCNTPHAPSGAVSGACYLYSGSDYYSANVWGDKTVSIPGNAWTKISTYVKKNTTSGGVGQHDGILRTWVDGVLADESTTVLYVTDTYSDTTWKQVILAPYIGDGSPIAQSMWIDELSLWTVSSSGGAEIEPSPELRLVPQ